MNLRRHLLEAVTLLVAAVLCALVANALASRERKLVLVGHYENPTTVPRREPAPPAAPKTADAPKAAPDLLPAAAAQPTPPAASARASTPLPARPRPAQAAAATASSTAAVPRSSVPGAQEGVAEVRRRFPPHGKPYEEISGDEVAWLQARGALVLDARRTRAYDDGHIAGARSFPVWESDIDERVTALLGEGRPADDPVVLYCSGGECEDSHMLAQKLFGAGFNNLRVYRDGWPDWQRRAGPSRTGPTP